MPKKDVEFSNNINIRITDDQRERWQNYIDSHPEFNSVSQFIRYCVDYMVDYGRIYEQIKEENIQLKQELEVMKSDIKNLQKTQEEILKMIAKL